VKKKQEISRNYVFSKKTCRSERKAKKVGRARYFIMAFGEKKEEEGGSVKQIVVRAFVSKNASGNSDRLATLQRPHNNRRRD